jgi:hypothetical protein
LFSLSKLGRHLGEGTGLQYDKNGMNDRIIDIITLKFATSKGHYMN